MKAGRVWYSHVSNFKGRESAREGLSACGCTQNVTFLFWHFADYVRKKAHIYISKGNRFFLPSQFWYGEAWEQR